MSSASSSPRTSCSSSITKPSWPARRRASADSERPSPRRPDRDDARAGSTQPADPPCSAGRLPTNRPMATSPARRSTSTTCPRFATSSLVEFVGSPLAHARIVALDVSRGRASRGHRGRVHRGRRARRQPLRPDLPRRRAAGRTTSAITSASRSSCWPARAARPSRGQGGDPARAGSAAGRSVDRRRDRRRPLHRPDPADRAGRRRRPRSRGPST